MSLFRTSAAALLLSTALTPAAWADLSAADVWQQFQDYSQIDENVTASFDSAEQSGDTLTVKNFVIATEAEQEFGSMKVVTTGRNTYGDVEFTENSDGSVTVSFGDKMQIASKSSFDGEDQTFMEGDILLDGLKVIAREDGDATAYSYSATSITFKPTDGFDGATLSDDTAFTVSGIEGSARVTQGEEWDIEQTIKADLFKGLINASDESEGTSIVNLEIADLSGEFDGLMPSSMDSSKPEQLIKALEDLSMRFNTGAMLIDVQTEERGRENKVRIEAGALTYGAEASDGTLSFDMAQSDAKISVTGGTPFPVNISGKTLGLAFGMPLKKNLEGAPAKFGLTLEGVQVNDEIWAMVDPTSQLPHDAVTVRAALSGAIKLFTDLTDEDGLKAAEREHGVPFEPVSAKIDELRIEGVGVKATGEGEVVFDSSDTESFDGMPAPIGKVTLNAEGTNSLIDNLIAMGIIPEDQATMTRMMISMFAQSTGDDSLRSEIEFKEGGKIFANGQQLR